MISDNVSASIERLIALIESAETYLQRDDTGPQYRSGFVNEHIDPPEFCVMGAAYCQNNNLSPEEGKKFFTAMENASDIKAYTQYLDWSGVGLVGIHIPDVYTGEVLEYITDYLSDTELLTPAEIAQAIRGQINDTEVYIGPIDEVHNLCAS